MSIFQSLILGAIQGLTEFLPVSSSGHLIFLPKLFGWADQGVAFDTVMHLGTLVAVVVYFRKKIFDILKSLFFFKKIQNADFSLPAQAGMQNDRKFAWLIILSIIPAAVVGLFFGNWLETSFRAPVFVGINMIFWGVVLYLADRYSYTLTHLHTYTLDKLNWKNSFFIGCAQAIALIPGTSRSGITMTAGLFSKLNKQAAAEFSFLMSVPIIALAGADGLWKIIRHGGEAIGFLPLSIGFLTSALVGYLAIDLLLKIIQKWSFTPFVLYRIVLGVLILWLL